MPLYHTRSSSDENHEEPQTDSSSASVSSSSSLLERNFNLPDEYRGNEEKRNRLNSDQFIVGQKIDVLDSANCWSEAEIVKVCRTTKRIFVTYLYWEDKWNEWLSESEIVMKVAPFRSQTYFVGGELKLRQRIEVKDTTGKWLEAIVVDEQPDSVKIHYFRFANSFDEWLPRQHSDRVRPFGQQKTLKKNCKLWKVLGLILPQNCHNLTRISTPGAWSSWLLRLSL